jgi:hypothetical protein
MRVGRLACSGVMAAAALALPACKPPPTDAAMARAANVPASLGPSEPMASPPVEGAIWAQSKTAGRLVYGIPGQPVLVSLQCLAPGTPAAQLRITRHAPADRDAQALLAVIGNRYIGRFPVDATKVGGRQLWQGEAPAIAQGWNALVGPLEVTVTVPGAGLVRLNPSSLPGQLVEACRKVEAPASPTAPA